MIRRTRKIRTIGRAFAVAALVALSVTGLPSVASAHDTDHCLHGDIDPPGGWYDQYLFHYTTAGGAHYNVYRHYLDGVAQHDEYNRCN
jgi:hypothetical protein